MGKAKTYDGTDIAISFDAKRCIHARNCVLKLGEVFDPDKRPWIDPDGAPAEAAAAVVRSCPSGALSYSRKDGGLEEAPPKLNRVAVLENGPLAVTGALEMAGEEMTRVTLCRCGLSGNKPFCDNSHRDGGFEATGEPEEAKSKEIGSGSLTIGAEENGPFMLDGPAEVVSGTGRRVRRAGKLFLCRCGHSKNKPFCDGSHEDAGFKADAV